VPGHDQRLYFRNLPAAAIDSCRGSQPVGLDLLERPAISLESRLLPCQFLPALDDDVDVLGVQFDAAADAVC